MLRSIAIRLLVDTDVWGVFSEGSETAYFKTFVIVPISNACCKKFFCRKGISYE